jgi:hypothetical protein
MRSCNHPPLFQTGIGYESCHDQRIRNSNFQGAALSGPDARTRDFRGERHKSDVSMRSGMSQRVVIVKVDDGQLLEARAGACPAVA